MSSSLSKGKKRARSSSKTPKKSKKTKSKSKGKKPTKKKVKLSWNKLKTHKSQNPAFSPWMLSKEPRKGPDKKGSWVCYVLRSKNPAHARKTYVGKTNDLFRRLRQHNGELKGGAKYTSGKGPWEPFVVVKGFKYEHECLQFEWAMHNPIEEDPKKKKRKVVRRHGQKGRCKSLEVVLSKKRWTSSAPLMKNYPLVVETSLSKVEYCEYAGISLEEFDKRRAKKPKLSFGFEKTVIKLKSSL